ncbi:MAG: hypothetical protein OEZ21_04300 [Candidatus Bathyarchaeota archaeon]|nr:hypothetical protein [Candidatus Bathyarchaeota archaeon]MDH5746164.1 hypothetical protein [Candidatus Bathyarchaeota archaeon]
MTTIVLPKNCIEEDHIKEFVQNSVLASLAYGDKFHHVFGGLGKRP